MWKYLWNFVGQPVKFGTERVFRECVWLYRQVMLHTEVSTCLTGFELTLLGTLYNIFVFSRQEVSRSCKLLVLPKFSVCGTSHFSVD